VTPSFSTKKSLTHFRTQATAFELASMLLRIRNMSVRNSLFSSLSDSIHSEYYRNFNSKTRISADIFSYYGFDYPFKVLIAFKCSTQALCKPLLAGLRRSIRLFRSIGDSWHIAPFNSSKTVQTFHSSPCSSELTKHYCSTSIFSQSIPRFSKSILNL
jgi:hypothetical protein